MPNFKCLRVKKLVLPLENDGVRFEWMAQSANFRLVLVCFEGAEFFIQISQNDKNEFVIKGEKHSKPQQIGFLQKALTVFKNAFCEGILNEAFALKSTRLMASSAYLARNLSDLKAKMLDFNESYLEIGFGSGRHLLFKADKNRDILMLGAEIYLPALEQVAKLAKIQGLNNVFLINADARLLLNALNSNSLSRIFLHFPVPWDKQESRRVVSRDFAREILRVLTENGRFELRTDSAKYFEFTREIFANFSVNLTVAKNENLAVLSKYETRWQKQKKDIFDLVVFKDAKFAEKFDAKNSNFKHKNLDFENSKRENLSENFDEILQNLSFDKKALKQILNSFESAKFEDKRGDLKGENLSKFKENKDEKKISKIAEFKGGKLKFRGENYFLSIENLYFIDEKNLLLSLAFGAFDKSEHAFLLLNKTPKFLFKTPFETQQNLSALKKLCEILTL